MFWDLGGQQSLRVLWDNYYSEANAVAYVLDSADRERFPEAKAELGISRRLLSTFSFVVLRSRRENPAG